MVTLCSRYELLGPYLDQGNGLHGTHCGAQAAAEACLRAHLGGIFSAQCNGLHRADLNAHPASRAATGIYLCLEPARCKHAFGLIVVREPEQLAAAAAAVAQHIRESCS